MLYFKQHLVKTSGQEDTLPFFMVVFVIHKLQGTDSQNVWILSILC